MRALWRAGQSCGRRWQPVARCRNRGTEHDAVQYRSRILEAMVPGRSGDRMFSGTVPELVLRPACDERDDGERKAVQNAAGPCAGARLARRRNAQVEGERDPLRRSRGSVWRRSDAIYLCGAEPNPESELPRSSSESRFRTATRCRSSTEAVDLMELLQLFCDVCHGRSMAVAQSGFRCFVQ